MAAAPGFEGNPDYRVAFERSPRRVRVRFNGETVADSTDAHLLFETRHLPVYYFPRADVRLDLMTPTADQTFCPDKGTASYWTIKVGDRAAENAVWGYPEPFEEVAAIADFVAFYWDRVDAWYEEDEEIFVHPRDPYKRVDVLQSSRPVKVIVGGVTAAETRRARFLFETRLPTRYYVPPEDVRMDLLVAERQDHRLPLQGPGALLLGQDRRPAVRGSRLVLSRTDPRMPQDQRLSLFLQRAGRRDPGRRYHRPATADPVVAGLAGTGEYGSRSAGPVARP